MSNQLNLGRGSKRNVRNVRWKRSEIWSLLLLLTVMAVVAVAAALWINAHDNDSRLQVTRPQPLSSHC